MAPDILAPLHRRNTAPRAALWFGIRDEPHRAAARHARLAHVRGQPERREIRLAQPPPTFGARHGFRAPGRIGSRALDRSSGAGVFAPMERSVELSRDFMAEGSQHANRVDSLLRF